MSRRPDTEKNDSAPAGGSRKLVRQWPGYLAWAAVASLAATAAYLLRDLSYDGAAEAWQAYLVDFLSLFVFYLLAQAAFPAFLVKLKSLPSTLGLCFGLGGGLGTICLWLFGLPWGLGEGFGMMLVIQMVILGSLIGILVGLGWNISKGRPLTFWLLFPVALALITVFYYYTTPAGQREVTVWYQGLTALIQYLPISLAIWWRHRPVD